MNNSRAKNFEQKFKSDWTKTVPNSFILRLADQVSGYKTYSQNPCDFICFAAGKLFLAEIKTHAGASIPFDCIVQYDRLKKYITIPGVFPGIVLWLYEQDIGIIYIPISTIKQMKADGLKSFGIRHLNNPKYKSYILPSTKKIVFWDTDYSMLLNLEDE